MKAIRRKAFVSIVICICFIMVSALAADFTLGTLSAAQKEGWLWPVPTWKHLSRGFNTKAGSMHGGVDIDAASGSEVRAAKAGTVVTVYSGCTNTNGNASGQHCTDKGKCNPKKNGSSNSSYYNGCCNSGYGNGLVIRHTDGTYGYYAHMKSVSVQLNATVQQGALLGYVGSTGNSTGPHLHFGIGANASPTVCYDNNPNSSSFGLTVAGYNNGNPLWSTDQAYLYDKNGISYTTSVTTDSENPKISNVKITNITSNGYTVTCDVSDNKGVTKVAFPTWTEWNGQDDLASTWPSVTVSSGANQTKTVSYTVKTSDHYGEVGTYITHIYAYDAVGNASYVTQSNYSCLRFDIVDKLPNRYTLPKNLKQIGDEAFANTGIQVATIPDATTKIGSKAFPSDLVVYWKKSIARSIASDAMPGVRVFDTTQYTAWSAWSGWTNIRETITDSNLKQEETRTVYPYYAFVCPTCGFHSPYWGSSANHNHTISSSDFRVNVENITTPKSGCTQYNSIKYETTYNGEKWYYWDDSSAPQPHTQYRYRTRQVK